MNFGQSITAYGGSQARVTERRPTHLPKIYMAGPPHYPAWDITTFGARWAGDGPTNSGTYANTVSNIYPSVPSDATVKEAYAFGIWGETVNPSINFNGRAALIVDLEGTESVPIQTLSYTTASYRAGVEWHRDHLNQLHRVFPGEMTIVYSTFLWGWDGTTSRDFTAYKNAILGGRRYHEVSRAGGIGLYNPVSAVGPGCAANSVTYEQSINEWTYEGVRAYRIAYDKCLSNPLVAAFLTSTFLYGDYTPIPDAQLLSQAQAAVRGGAHFIVFWDEFAYRNGYAYDHPAVVAEQQRALNIFRRAFGLAPITTFELPSESSGSSLTFSGDSTGGPTAVSTGSVPTSSVSLPSWVSAFSSPSSSARAACPTLPSSGTVTTPFSLSAGSSSYTGIQVTSGSGNAITGANDVGVKTLSLTDSILTGFNYSLYLGDCETLNAHNCKFTSTTGGNNYSIRGYIRQVNIGCSTITNPGGGGSTKACFRVYGFEGGLIHDTVFTGDRVMLGGGPAAEAVGPLDSYGLLFQDVDMAITTLEIYPETHHITFENCDFTLTHITCWGADGASLQDPACHDITFINCTNNGHALNFAQDFNGGSNVAAHALALNIVIV